MWIWLTYKSHPQNFLVNMDKVAEVYATSENITVLDYGDGNSLQVVETPAQIAKLLNVR